ncbi:MAG: exodeoxyribonuclease VII large subunit [Gemmatimonadota bacterium]|nr:MAG: exodeoxyribonuclease VII large subunit [Gemmatimonadota bacterium]
MGGGLDLFSAAAVDSGEGAWSVSDVTKRARRIIEAGMTRVWVKGEVSGFKAYRSGHWYFSLRDAEAQVRCVMWRTDNRRLPGQPDEGTQVFVEARPTVWEERGEFRLTVKQLVPTEAGGLWQLRLEQAKAALARDGLLDVSRKRPLPDYPQRIAVVTSLDGAALRDIVSVISRRWPAVELLVIAVRVQGDGAEQELCGGLELVNRIPDLDLVIVGRGGGSREDLWTFNSERVARAVAAVNVPTISAVGHETDVALTDLVADLRAPTPSAAAEAAVPSGAEIEGSLNNVARRLARGLTTHAQLGRERLARTSDRLSAVVLAQLEQRQALLERLSGQLEALSPLKVLQRGYSVARDESGNVLKQIADFAEGSEFRLTVSDGDIEATVRETGKTGDRDAGSRRR